MIKFMLVLKLCYSGGMCLPPVPAGMYDDYKSCAIEGYVKSLNYIDNLDDKTIEETRPIVQFWCQEYENKEEKIQT